MSYATTTDLQARWRTLDSQELVKADLILGDVERDLRREFPDLDTRLTTDANLALEVKRITCSVTRRRMVTEDAEDLDDVTENSGTFGRRITSTTLDTGLELTSQERRILTSPTTAASNSSVAVAQWSNDDTAVDWWGRPTAGR